MLEVVDRGSGLVVPVIPVALIDRIDASSLGDTDIGMGQQEFSHARIKCKPMHALTGRINQHGRSAVQEIAGGYLFGTGLEDFIELHFTGTAGLTAQDGENGPDVDVHIDVGGAIQRVKDQHVVPAGECRRNAHQFRILFGSYGAQHTGTLHPVQKNPVGKIVKLLDILTLNVDIPGAAKNIKQTSLIYAAGYDFGRKNKIMKQRSKVARRLRSPLLLQKQMFGDGDFRRHEPSLWVL